MEKLREGKTVGKLRDFYWFERAEGVKKFILENNRKPFTTKEEVKLRLWLNDNLKYAGSLPSDKAAKLQEIKDIVSGLEGTSKPLIFQSKRDQNWFAKAEQIKFILTEQKRLPKEVGEEWSLRVWLKGNISLFEKNELLNDKQAAIQEILDIIKTLEIELSAKEKRWRGKFEELILFRKDNPDGWPSMQKEQEKGLAIWLQGVRRLQKMELLDTIWDDKFKLIGVDFEKRGFVGMWKERFEELKLYFQEHHKVPDAGTSLYAWLRINFKKFEKLTKEQQGMLNSIAFLNYFNDKNWHNRYEELKEFVELNNKLPTKRENSSLLIWLRHQKFNNKIGKLSEEKRNLLTECGIVFDVPRNFEERWNSRFEALKKFREENPDRWPSHYSTGDERRLYEWSQAQRQVYAGTAKKRKELTQERIDKLNEIGFVWTQKERVSQKWEENFNALSEFIATNGTKIPTKIDGQYNPISVWLHNQKVVIKKNKMPEEKIERLKSLGLRITMPN